MQNLIRQSRSYSTPESNIIHAKRMIKRYVLPAFIDISLVVLVFYATLSLRHLDSLPAVYAGQFIPWVIIASAAFVASNFLWRIYDRMWRYSSVEDVLALLKASFVATFVLVVVDFSVVDQASNHPLPLSHVLLVGLLSLVLMSVVRYRHVLAPGGVNGHRATPGSKDRDEKRVRVLVVGAGAHGQRVANHLRADEGHQELYDVVGFIDDDPAKQGMRIGGIRVLGTRHEIPTLVRELDIDHVVIASRASFGDSFEELVAICQRSAAQIKLMPRYNELFSKRNNLPNLRDLTIEDLLERTPIKTDLELCRELMIGRVVMVTGAAGSIGSELCRQLVEIGPKKLVLIDNNETGLHELYLELHELLELEPSVELCPVVADITDARKLRLVFRRFQPDIVFHAAAYKHVPVMETNPDEAVRVNVLGSINLIELAHQFRVDRFILISTDKAVNPSCVMGASKRLAELWLAARHKTSKTRFAAVRFGNVVGSRGSVVPLFKRQIEKGGPVTVTDPRMTRFFMSIPEAASLIIQAATFTQGGEIFMLDMGQPIQIINLAEKMIRLKGLRPGKDIRIKFIGSRPGEKLHEELSYHLETKRPTPHPKIYCLESQMTPARKDLVCIVNRLTKAIYSERAPADRLRDLIMQAAIAPVSFAQVGPDNRSPMKKALQEQPLAPESPGMATYNGASFKVM